ncbi:MAG: hypothetical protein JWM16_3526 [Verrucomicrobiales bacterium]|nr:hypothetical protein [Verrucomicrobiales bacterium]
MTTCDYCGYENAVSERCAKCGTDLGEAEQHEKQQEAFDVKRLETLAAIKAKHEGRAVKAIQRSYLPRRCACGGTMLPVAAKYGTYSGVVYSGVQQVGFTCLSCGKTIVLVPRTTIIAYLGVAGICLSFVAFFMYHALAVGESVVHSWAGILFFVCCGIATAGGALNGIRVRRLHPKIPRGKATDMAPDASVLIIHPPQE